MKNLTDLLARILLAGVFIYDAVDSIVFSDETKARMSYFGIEWQQDLLLTASIAVLILGGILILLGYRMGLGGFLILAYWLPVTFIAHAFWTAPPEAIRWEAMVFAKNLAIAAGVMLLMIKGSGKYSVKRLLTVTRIPKGET